jgi:hypothetical protein
MGEGEFLVAELLRPQPVPGAGEREVGEGHSTTFGTT